MHCSAASFVVLMLANAAYAEFNLTEYKRMPALYQLGDYDLCLQQPASQPLTHSSYCLVYAEIVPNVSSTLWQQIEHKSQDTKHNFRHDHLFVGVCLESCKDELKNLSRIQEQQPDAGKGLDSELSSYFAQVYRRASDERLQYDPLVNRCLNREFTRKYQLRLRSSIVYCQWADEQLQHDALDVIVYVLLALLPLLTVLSSYYDYRLKLRLSSLGSAHGNLFYQQQQQGTRIQRLCCAFSICRNYYRVVLPGVGEYSKDLRFFDAFRVFGVFFVISAHTIIIYVVQQIQNPEFVEQFLNSFESSLLQNGPVVLQIFFAMSAFLLYVNFTTKNVVNQGTGILNCLGIYIKVFIYRYLRIVPSLILLILFSGTILTRMGDGPFWRHLTEAERVFCRQNWWKNVFFINNFMLKDSCMHQSWYLAADMQLYEIFFLIIIITNKYPTLTRPIYIVLFLVTFTVPALLTYFLKLEAVYHLTPETYRYLFFRNSETFYQIYLPFYTNMEGYLMGFLCARLYLKLRATSAASSYKGNWKFEFGLWLLFPAAFMVLFSGYIFIKHDFEKPSIWLALYAVVYKNLWSLISAGFIIGMCFKIGWIAYEFCSLSFFRPLARISFQAYLWHITVLRLVSGYYREPVYINFSFVIGNIVLVFVLTQVLAFVIVLLFEYPLAEIVKYLTMSETAETSQTASKSAESHLELNSRQS